MKQYGIVLYLVLIIFTNAQNNHLFATDQEQIQHAQTFSQQTTHTDNPLLIIVLMVKNEEPVIQDTLQPFIDAGLDSFLIFDTGSTDSTIAVTQKFFEENHVSNAVIKQEPFVNFSVSRNRSLELAQEAFPNARFMLMLDAEWYMHNVAGLLTFCQSHKNDNYPAYLVRLTSPESDFYTARLIRCRSNIFFVGPVHEVINYPTQQKVPETIFFELKTTQHGAEKSQKRWTRDCKLLLDEYVKNPKDPRTVFYLAQTYHCLGDLGNTIKFYELRLSMPGWDQETFITQLRLAHIYVALNNWDKALHYYLAAISSSPHRAEPYVYLAQHYWDTGEHALCFLFARRAVELPYPQDVLFVEKELYDFTRYDLLGRSAWYMEEYALGEQAVHQALKVHPDLEYLQINTSLFASKHANG